MSSRNLTIPFFPNPPQTYDSTYMEDIIRSFAIYVAQVQNPGQSRSTTAVMTNLPTSDSGLEEGALFERNGFLKIALNRMTNPDGLSGTGAVGSVTVTIS